MGYLLGLLALISLISVSYNCESLLTEKDDLELERQLKLLNKPSIKTVKTQMGDIYDCIDINKQPALDHPLLQNHKIQTSTSRIATSTSTDNRFYQMGNLVTVDCPQGTVPIRRVAKEDLRRARYFTETYVRNMHEMTQESPGSQFATERLKNNVVNNFHAIQGYHSLYNLPNVVAGQSSSSHMWIERGATSLQTGWIVSPDLYGSTLTRLFIYWKTGDDGGCFNLLCSGFVQVDRNIPVDIVFNHTSEYGGDKIYATLLQIELDPKTNSWWLYFMNDIRVGYWPSGLLPEFDKNGASASHVAWGGLATGSANGRSPPMGNGHRNDYGFARMAMIFQLKVVDSSNEYVDPHEYDLEQYLTGKGCYSVRYNGQGKKWGHYVTYGGPGGKCGS